MSGGPSLMDSLFQRTLEDLIKGLRLHLPGADTATFISKSVDEIRREIKSTDLNTKSIALQKLTYLHSLHAIDMSSWASFHAIELTSSPSFSHKKIGYLAVSLSFNSSTDVLLLLTNQLRKDLSSANQFEVSLALETLSVICTPDLARDLTPNISTLVTSSKSFVRKKAIVTMLRVFNQYPDAVRVCFKRLVENLESSDMGTVSATVSVFCELAMKDPTSYLPLAPEFYKILVDCRNNWVLIKVLKVFAKLAELEPRLAKKVVDPICEHLRRSGAKSLVFECVRTIVTSLNEYESAVKLAVEKIREFLIDDDSNLKYLGLQGLSIVSLKHLWAVVENKEVVIKSLSDADVNIKLEALKLVMAMVSDVNVAEICRVLINYAIKSDPEFCNEILQSILSTCGNNIYEIIIDFDWYVSLLGEMSRIQHCQKGEEIEKQLIDIGLRVKDVRPELVRVGRDLLIDPALLGNPFIHRILSAAAWLTSEYVLFSKNPCELMEALLQPRTNLLPASIRAVYIHSAFKVLTFCLYSYMFSHKGASLIDSEPGDTNTGFERKFLGSTSSIASVDDQIFERGVSSHVEDVSSTENGLDENVCSALEQTSSSVSFKKELFTRESINNLLNLVETALSPLAGSHEVEIQERVSNVLGLIGLVRPDISGSVVQKEGNFESGEPKASEITKLVHDALSEELGPISLSAQERIPVPDGLLLEENLNALETICSDILLPISSSFSLPRPGSDEPGGFSLQSQTKEESELSTESTSLLAEHRKRHGLYYLSSGKDMAPDYYPPANDPKMQDTVNVDTEDLVKLTEQSFFPKKKPNQVKARPVVVRLDEGDGSPIVTRKTESKDVAISGAVRDVLLGNETDASSSQVDPSDKFSSNVRGKERFGGDQSFESKENISNIEKSERDTSKSRRSKNHKERRHRSSEKTSEGREENGQRDKQKSGHHHGRHKARHRADGGLKVVAQTPVIPDFLL